jgi:hypothetical protein
MRNVVHCNSDMVHAVRLNIHTLIFMKKVYGHEQEV